MTSLHRLFTSWRRIVSAVRGRASPVERYLGQSVDFADLERRLRVAYEADLQRRW